MRHRWAWGLVVAAVTAPVTADEAHYWVPTAVAARVEVGARSGLVIGAEAGPGGSLVTVSHEARALDRSPAYPLPGRVAGTFREDLQVPPGFAVPGELAAAVRDADRALDVLLAAVAFVSQRVRLDEQDRGPQDAPAVLARRVARCSGRANLAVGLLRALGVPARVVNGVLMGDGGPQWHRWGEAHLGSLGWIAFDPGSSVGMVSVRHVPLRGAGGGTSLRGVEVRRLDEQVFQALPVRSGLRVVPTGGVTVHCEAPLQGADLTAVLLGPDGSRWSRRGRGEVRFPGLLPGHYRLYWWSLQRSGRFRMDLGGTDEIRLLLGADGEVGS